MDLLPGASARRARPLRVLLVDHHIVFRAACRALLMTQGLEVVADLPPSAEAVKLAAALRPDVALVDVVPSERRGFDVARQLVELRGAPTVVLMSSVDISGLAAELGVGSLAKADVCAEAISSVLRRLAPQSIEQRIDRELPAAVD